MYIFLILNGRLVSKQVLKTILLSRVLQPKYSRNTTTTNNKEQPTLNLVFFSFFMQKQNINKQNNYVIYVLTFRHMTLTQTFFYFFSRSFLINCQRWLCSWNLQEKYKNTFLCNIFMSCDKLTSQYFNV